MWQYNRVGKEAIRMVAYGGVALAQIDPGRHMAFATPFCTAKIIIRMEKG